MRLNGPVHDKTDKMMCTQWRLGSAWPFSQSDQSSLSAWRNLESLATHWAYSKDSSDSPGTALMSNWPAWHDLSCWLCRKTSTQRFKLGRRPGWSQSSLDAHIIFLVFSCSGSNEMAQDGWTDWQFGDFISFLKVFQSYKDNEMVIMKGSCNEAPLINFRKNWIKLKQPWNAYCFAMPAPQLQTRYKPGKSTNF